MMMHRYVRNVATLKLDRDACKGCGLCQQVCPHAVFAMEEGKAVIRDRDACMECGACVRNCPYGALDVKPGVGCAAAILYGMLHGTEPDCGSGCCGAEDADDADESKAPTTAGTKGSCC